MWRRSLPVLALLAGAASAQEAPPGAAACSGCHGAGGITLAGLDAAQIRARMAEFRAGEGEATLMPRIAAGFTEAETAAIAAWLAQEG